jgi:hypothetical protein
MAMQTRTLRTSVTIVAIFVMSMMWSSAAFAGGVSLSLVRATLTNVNDTAGRWQHEGGRIMKGAAVVGQYAIHRRVTFGGTDAQNTAMTTVTLFFSNTGAPPQNVTLQGSHSFSNGRFAGSVSASSNRYAWIHAADAVIAPTAVVGTSTLTLQWTGANQLTLP